MPVVNSCCCGKASLKAGSVVIGVLLLIFSIAFLIVTVGFVAAWEDFDTDFLDDRLSKSNSSTAENVREQLAELTKTFQEEIRPVWKKEFISLYCFLPWYALANILLIVGAKKEIRFLLLLWILFSIGFLIWSFVLISIMFTYDTTPHFVIGLAIAQIVNFIFMTSFILVVFSLYQELRCKRVMGISHQIEDLGRGVAGQLEEAAARGMSAHLENALVRKGHEND